MTGFGTTGESRPARALGLLGAALLSVTAFVSVPVEIYRVATLDFASASRDLLVAVFVSGLLLFALMGSCLALLPARVGRHVGASSSRPKPAPASTAGAVARVRVSP